MAVVLCYEGKRLRYRWTHVNAETHECQHMDRGACAKCRRPMDPQSYSETKRVRREED